MKKAVRGFLKKHGARRVKELYYLLLERWKVRIYIISAPKSGRTWLSVMLLRIFALRYDKPAQFECFRTLLNHKPTEQRPEIYLSHHHAHPDVPGTQPLTLNRYQFWNKPVLFLARDPRDVVVSHYHQLTKRSGHFTGTLSAFIRDPQYGIERVIAFMNMWADASRASFLKDFCLVRYEDMLEDSQGELKRILSFLGYGDTFDEHIAEAVQFAHFENLKKLERANHFNDNRLRAKDPNDNDTYKVRKGKSGTYREELSADDIAFVNMTVQENLDPVFRYM